MTQPRMRMLLTGMRCYPSAIIGRFSGPSASISGQIGACQAALRSTLDSLFRRRDDNDDPPAFQLALAHDLAPLLPWQNAAEDRKPNRGANDDPLAPLAALLDPFSWAVTKKVRTRYVARRRWFTVAPNSKRSKYGMPLLNVTHCLECNNLTLPNCVCPHCYSKVREKTEELKAKLGNDFKYRHPLKEVKFVYDNEHFGTESSKHVVKLEGERPSWFSKAVLPRKGSS